MNKIFSDLKDTNMIAKSTLSLVIPVLRGPPNRLHYISRLKTYTKQYCAFLGITDSTICDNVIKKCIQDVDDFEDENFDLNHFNIKNNNIVDQESCAKAWGSSVQNQVNEIVKSAKLRHLLYKLKGPPDDPNDPNDRVDYHDTKAWINHIVPDKLKDSVSQRLNHEFDNVKTVADHDDCKKYNIHDRECSLDIYNDLIIDNNIDKIIPIQKYIQDLPIEDELLDPNDSITLIKKFFNINIPAEESHIKLTDILSVNQIELKYKSIQLEQQRRVDGVYGDRTSAQITQYGKIQRYIDNLLKTVDVHERKQFLNIINWLAYWQQYHLPLFGTVFYSTNNLSPSDRIKFHNLTQEYEQLLQLRGGVNVDNQILNFYPNLMGVNQHNLIKKLIQTIFILDDREYNYSNIILTDYKSIMTNNQHTSYILRMFTRMIPFLRETSYTIELNDYIIHTAHDHIKDIFKDIAITTGTETQSKYNIITLEDVEGLFNQIRYSNISSSIQTQIINGILQLLKIEFKIDPNNYKNEIISKAIIKREYYRTIAQISDDEKELLKLSYQLQNMRILEEQTDLLEVQFPIGDFPIIFPMQKVLFLIRNETNLDKILAFYQALKNDDVTTSIGDLTNIIHYFLEILKERGITIENEGDIIEFVRTTNSFDKKLVKTARILQILGSVEHDGIVSGVSEYLDPTNHIPNIDNITISIPTREGNQETIQNYLKTLNIQKKSISHSVSNLKKIKLQLSKYAEIQDFLRLVRKHYYYLQ